MPCSDRWTVWRKLAEDDEYLPVDFQKSACYQLGIGGPRGGGIRIKYIGYSSNLRDRMRSYGNHGSNISKEIDEAIEEGYSIFYRFKKCNTEQQAQECEQRQLRQLSRLRNRSRYMWNKVWS